MGLYHRHLKQSKKLTPIYKLPAQLLVTISHHRSALFHFTSPRHPWPSSLSTVEHVNRSDSLTKGSSKYAMCSNTIVLGTACPLSDPGRNDAKRDGQCLEVTWHLTAKNRQVRLVKLCLGNWKSWTMDMGVSRQSLYPIPGQHCRIIWPPVGGTVDTLAANPTHSSGR